MTKESRAYKPTPEQLARWKRMDELEPGAMVGRLPSWEQQDKNVKQFLETDYIQNQLEETRTYKKKQGLSRILKLFAIPEEKDFYSDLGFAETNGSGEMILSENDAAMLLLDLELKRNLDTFD